MKKVLIGIIIVSILLLPSALAFNCEKKLISDNMVDESNLEFKFRGGLGINIIIYNKDIEDYNGGGKLGVVLTEFQVVLIGGASSGLMDIKPIPSGESISLRHWVVGFGWGNVTITIDLNSDGQFEGVASATGFLFLPFVLIGEHGPFPISPN